MKFNVPKMSCAHCTAAIETGIKEKDPNAKVTTDLATKHVTVASDLLEAEIQQSIADAGYDAVPA